MPHIKPLPHDTHEQFKERFNQFQDARGFIPNGILTMQRRPNIAEAIMALIKAVLYEGNVPIELKTLVSLMASHTAGCRYCESHAADLASVYKAPDHKIAAIYEFETSEIFSDSERAALRLAMKASVVPNATDESDFAELRKYFDDAEIVEIVASISLFGYLNRWNDTMATAVEDHPAKVAARAMSKVGWHPGKHG